MADLKMLCESAELMPWVPTSRSPLRVGAFQVRNAVRNQDELWFSLWDGARWHGAWDSPDEAFQRERFPTAGSVSTTWEWRGLALDPLTHPI